MAFALPEGVPAPTRNRIVEFHFKNLVGEIVARPALINHVDETSGTVDVFVFYNDRLDGAYPGNSYKVKYGLQPHGWTWPPRV